VLEELELPVLDLPPVARNPRLGAVLQAYISAGTGHGLLAAIVAARAAGMESPVLASLFIGLEAGREASADFAGAALREKVLKLLAAEPRTWLSPQTA
jgi:hypothetical protein